MLPLGTSAVFDVALSVSAATAVSRSPIVKFTGVRVVSSFVVTLAIAVIVGAEGNTVNGTPLLATPPRVTVTLPVVAPLGTSAKMFTLLQNVVVAGTPLNETVLVPFIDPKFVPVIRTDALTAPLAGDSNVIFGTTVNVTPLLASPPPVTVTGPVVAPLGTGTVMLVSLQSVGVAVTPLNETVLVPFIDP